MREYHQEMNGTALNMGLVATISEVIRRAGAWNQYISWVKEVSTGPALLVRDASAQMDYMARVPYRSIGR